MKGNPVKTPSVADMPLYSVKHFIYLILLLIVVLYGNTLRNGYSLDDDFVIYRNETVQKGLDGIGEILTTHYSENEKSRYEYRPLVKITFAIEYELFGLNPAVSHAINLLLYFLTIVLVFKVMLKLFPQHGGLYAALTSLFFAVHPVHTEVVASLKNRDELLSFLLCMLATYLVLKFVDRKKWYWLMLAFISYVFAYYSKSSALVFAALIPLIVYFYSPKHWKLALLLFISVLAIAYFLRQFPKEFLPKGHRNNWYFENPLFLHRGLLFRFGTGLVAILFYIRLLIFPHPLRFYYGYDTIPLTHFPDLLSLFALFIFIGLMVFALLKLKKRHVLSFAILFFFIAVSMFSNILKPAMGIVAERYIYAASLGFCLAVSWVLMQFGRIHLSNVVSWKKLPRPFLFIVVALLILGGGRTVMRNNDWKSTLSLLYADIPHLDNSFKANLLIANTLLADATNELRMPSGKVPVQKYAADAAIYFQRAVEIWPDYANAWNSYGALYYMIFRDYNKAVPLFRNALRLDSAYTEASFNLGFCFQKLHLLDSAKFYFENAIKTDSLYTRAYTQIGMLSLEKHDTVAFIEIQNDLMRKVPNSDEPYINLGNFYMQIGDTLKGIFNWEKAASLQTENPALMLNLANYFLSIGDNDKYSHYNRLYGAALSNQKKNRGKWN